MAIIQEQDYEFQGDVEVSGSLTVKTGAPLKIEDGATNGYVLTSDAAGVATWQASGAGSGLLQQTTVTITDAQIKNINSVPIILIPAQGANTIIVPILFAIDMTYATTPYTGDTTLRFFIGTNQYTLESGALVATANYYSQRTTTLGFSFTGGNLLLNNPLVVTTAATNPLSGDSPITIVSTYYVINL